MKFRKLAQVTAFTLLVGAGASAADAPSATPTCIRHWPEVLYRNYGYDHLVHIKNDCRTRAVCAVATNVNPKPTEVPVAAGEQVDVLTMRGSPAREFTATVECRFVP
jgi:hypothetical protein